MADIFDYKLITPDGQVFNVKQPNWAPEITLPDGFGLPPIDHDTQGIYGQPGAMLKGINVQARSFQLALDVNGITRANLHDLRRKLFSTLRWNRTTSNPPDFLILRYTLNDQAADLHCYYLGDNFSEIKDSEKNQNAVISLVAYDPFWYRVQGSALAATLSITSEVKQATLDVQSTMTVNYIMGKFSGIWNDMNGAGTDVIYEILFGLDGDSVYVLGKFTNLDGIANADYAAKYTISTDTWSALATGPGTVVNAGVFAANGNLYVATNAGVKYWDGVAWIDLTPTPADSSVIAIALDSTGIVYVTGSFTTINGVAANRCAKYSGGAWSALGTGLDATGRAVAVNVSGSVYFGGEFTTANGVSAQHIARWTGSTFAVLGAGVNDRVNDITFGPDGSLYAVGDFTTAGGISALRIARWNGANWVALGTGLDNKAAVVEVSSTGLVYVGGEFNSAGGLALTDSVAVWNGSSWAQIDANFPGSARVEAIALRGQDMVFGFDTSGLAIVSGVVIGSISMLGDFNSFPVFTFTGPGTLQWIENVDVDLKMIFNLAINAGETVTIDLTLGRKTISSDARGNLLLYSVVLPLSDFGEWALSPDPIAPLGNNTIAMLMTGTTPVEVNDNNNQLSGYASITGVTPDNTAAGGILYITINSLGGGNYSINLYSDAARTQLVGHTASYNSNGAKAIIADNSSGLGGTITVDARVAADSDLYVYFATAKITYNEPFLSADAAVTLSSL